jgi:hypothetical protein
MSEVNNATDIISVCKNAEHIHFYNTQRQKVYTFEEWVQYVHETFYPHIDLTDVYNEAAGNPSNDGVVTSQVFYASLAMFCKLVGINIDLIYDALTSNEKWLNAEHDLQQIYSRIVNRVCHLITYSDTIIASDWPVIVEEALTGVGPTDPADTALQIRTKSIAQSFIESALLIGEEIVVETRGSASEAMVLTDEAVVAVSDMFSSWENLSPYSYVSMNKVGAVKTFAQSALTNINEFIHALGGGIDNANAGVRYTVFNVSVIGNHDMTSALEILAGTQVNAASMSTAYIVRIDPEIVFSDMAVLVDSADYGYISKMRSVQPSVEGMADMRGSLEEWLHSCDTEIQDYAFTRRISLFNLQATIMAYANELKRAQAIMFFNKNNTNDLVIMPNLRLDVANAPFFMLEASLQVTD